MRTTDIINNNCNNVIPKRRKNVQLKYIDKYIIHFSKVKNSSIIITLLDGN